jgi:hypothetical protein
MLAEERPRLHQVPDLPHTAALGVTRRVPDNTPMVTFDHCRYSTPATLLGQSVWVRHHDVTDEIVICALDDGGPIEVARHRRTSPGTPAIDNAHLPDHHDKLPGDYRIRARTAAEHAFLAIGAGAAVWLKEVRQADIDDGHAPGCRPVRPSGSQALRRKSEKSSAPIKFCNVPQVFSGELDRQHKE